MIRLSCSFSKKTPAEIDFSSKSYHVSLETELSDGLSASEIQARIRETFALARSSVEAEINGHTIAEQSTPQTKQLAAHNPNSNQGGNNRGHNRNQAASNKQISYLTDLLRQHGYQVSDVCRQLGIQSLYDMTKLQCSQYIDQIQQNGQAA